MLDRQWDEALTRALPNSFQGRVFVEWREDLAADADSEADPVLRRTLWSGAAVDGADGNLTYHSDVVADDLAPLIEGRPPSERRSAPVPSVRLDHERARAAVGGAVVELHRKLPAGFFRASWVESEQTVLIGDAEGVVRDRRRSCRLRLEGILRRNGREASATAERTVRAADATPASLMDPLVERLEARLDVRDPRPGPVAVVFAPSIAGIWIHEVVGHPLEADRALKGASWISGAEPSLPRELEVIDDPRRGRNSLRLDDEGVPARPVALVHDGRFRDLLHSRATAAMAGVEPSGHGRRSSFRERVLPRMGCTFIANGSRHPDEILKNVERGIYVRRMESASTDTATGRAVFRVTDADSIVAGKLGAPLRSHLLESFAPCGLAEIDGIANDLAFDHCIGRCHRDGQPLSTSVGAPTICTRLMTVRF